jgi:glycosyltransferase involved in cell wall biosynthesis
MNEMACPGVPENFAQDANHRVHRVCALLWIEGLPENFIPTVQSLDAALPGIEIHVGGSNNFDVLGSTAAALSSNLKILANGISLASAVKISSAEFNRHLLIISAPVVLPPRALDRAIDAVDDDLRLATISFLSNAAGAFSVPLRNTPTSHQISVHDEVSITRGLREMSPPPPIVPVAAPAGAAVLLSHYALASVRGVDSSLAGGTDFLVADTALREARRGFLNALDTGTYITRAFDLGDYQPHPLDHPSSAEYQHLASRHPAAVNRFSNDVVSLTSPLASALTTASSKIRGLRIIIDARDLGPTEMGTQVQILSLARELAARNDVASLQLGIPGLVPAYAAPYLNSEKIQVFTSPSGDLIEADAADIIHRPSQPSTLLPFDAWRTKATRIIVTLQDLIAYQVFSYHANADVWQRYRDSLNDGALGADAVISISEETIRQIHLEQLPIDPSRLFVVPNGTDHLSGHEPQVFPNELSARGFLEQEFVLVLGTNYGHKNRDLAIRAWRLLRSSYPNLAIVLAGASVPTGSSRIEEALAIGSDASGVFTLPDVSSAERNWLMRHARVVLYPTSAEGFGLVPFEAARFGTPTVGVRFAPLNEFNDPPQWASGWTDFEIATAAGQLMESPEASDNQVRATLQNADRYRWSDTAAGLVHVYRSALSAPARRLPRG